MLKRQMQYYASLLLVSLAIAGGSHLYQMNSGISPERQHTIKIKTPIIQATTKKPEESRAAGLQTLLPALDQETEIIQSPTAAPMPPPYPVLIPSGIPTPASNQNSHLNSYLNLTPARTPTPAPLPAPTALTSPYLSKFLPGELPALSFQLPPTPKPCTFLDGLVEEKSLIEEKPSAYADNETNNKKGKLSNLERALNNVQKEKVSLKLYLVSHESKGIFKQIYDQLTKRKISATTGPDEGLDTSSIASSPYCVFVRKEDVNARYVEQWEVILKHEYAHSIQASNNRNLHSDFSRDSDGKSFGPIGLLMEACADKRSNAYGAKSPAPLLDILGRMVKDDELLCKACEGNPLSVQDLIARYEKIRGKDSFKQLFKPYEFIIENR